MDLPFRRRQAKHRDSRLLARDHAGRRRTERRRRSLDPTGFSGVARGTAETTCRRGSRSVPMEKIAAELLIEHLAELDHQPVVALTGMSESSFSRVPVRS